MTVVGQDVSANQTTFPGIDWVDINLSRKINLPSDLLSFWRLLKFLRAHKPDIVHSIMPKAGLLCACAAFICRVPVRVHTFTGQTWSNRSFPARIFLFLADWIIAALNTVCMTDSPSQSEYLARHWITYRGRSLPVLAMGSLSGVDLSRFTWPTNSEFRTAYRARLGIGKEDFVFAFIARKSRDKGAIDMLSAFSRVVNSRPTAKLLFVGPDESDGELLAMKVATPSAFNNVIDIGEVDSLDALFSVSDTLCLPSYREGFGSIVIDAAAAGVPAIGSRISGLVDAIEDGKTGVLTPAGDIEALSRAMLSMIENTKRREEMGRAARQRVEQYFSADLMYSSLKHFYDEQLGVAVRS